MGTFDQDVFLLRAFAAYYRAPAPTAQEAPPSVSHSTRAVVQGKAYVLLRTASGRTVAVYRITNQHSLRRLRRWPKPLMKEADG